MISEPRAIAFTVNNRPVAVHADPALALLDVLRDELRLTGTKQGCDHDGECGACTVLLDGQPVRSCLTPVARVEGRSVLTVEGLGPDHLSPLQQAFIAAGAVQCGYCTPGMLMAAKSLLDRDPDPSDAAIVDALDGHLCRCTGYAAIISAVRLAARYLALAKRSPQEADQLFANPDRRPDSAAKVTGQAMYVQDIVMPGLLYASVVRSPHPHARLTAIDTGRASSMPGVVRILTAEDIPGLNGFPSYSREEPVLPPVGQTVRMVGAPIALVVAETHAIAVAAAASVEPTFEILPYTYEAADALRPDAFPIAGQGNVLARYGVHNGDVDAALASSAERVDAHYHTAWLTHGTLERESLLGYIDDEGRVTIVGGNHEPHHQQGYVAGVLGVEPDTVRVIQPPTGGSFGGKQDPWPFAAVGLIVHHVRRPVRLVYSRRESFASSPKRHPYDVDISIGGTRSGRLTGFRARIVANTGGYDSAGQYLPTFAVTASGGPYRWQAADATAVTVYSNGPKAGQYRGFGTAQSVFATECALDELAERLGIDPFELRLQNGLRDGEVSFLGYPIADSMGFDAVLTALKPYYEDCAAEARERNAAAPDGSIRCAVGLAGMWYKFGKSGSLRIEAHAELSSNGRIVIYASAPDYGQGTNSTMGQLAAEALGVPRARITLVNADTARVPDSGIQGASRATFFVGGAVRHAALCLKDELLGTAAEMLDVSPARLRLDDGRVVDAAGRSVTLEELAREFDRIGKPRRLIGVFDLADRFPSPRPEYVPLFVTGAQAALVQVDMASGQTRVLRIAAAHDVGHAVNPTDARGQIEGAILMGLGAALMEEFVPGDTTSFHNYYLPTVKSMPQMDAVLVEVPSRLGPGGVKGLAEAPMLPTTPAIVNAISRAIGTRVRTIPATPERVLAAIRNARPPERA